MVTLEADDKKVKMNRTGKCKLKRYENEVKEMKRAMKQYVENGRSTPDEKVSNDTKNSWNQVKIFMQEE